MSTCPFSGDYANKKFDPNTTNGIDNGSITSHLDIDYWITQQASKLDVWGIKLAGKGNFKSTCPAARFSTEDELSPELKASLGVVPDLS